MTDTFLNEIEKIKAEAKKSYRNIMKIIPSNISTIKNKHQIDLNRIEMDRLWLENYAEKVILVLKEFTGESVAENLQDGLRKKYVHLEVLVKKVYNSDWNYLDNLAKKTGVEKEELYFLGLELGKPVYELYAEVLKDKLDLDNWGKGFCPVCGSPAALSYLRKEDGKRILWCQFCETQWSFMRLKCPFCSNEDQKSLRYFFTEEKDFYRVDVCDKCKSYIKTIDQRKMPHPNELSLYRESMQTLFLDLLAERDGYSSLSVQKRV
ncbi:MAG: formate dehydrogenase accessory protein FdhE [candidate division Zixibacteria bacterium]|nr:formate dehydrogenase accessory protein FdhE [candidate division Zixibacteria bacterium]